MTRVLLDCDGVLGDFPSEVLRFCNRYGRDTDAPLFKLSDVNQHDVLKSFGIEHLQARLDQHMIDSDFCRHIPLYPGACEFVKQLQWRHEVVIVTSPYGAVPNWTHARVEWLAREFGIDRSNVVFAKRKELVSGDVLIDDQTNNCRAFGRAICFDRPWNQDFKGLRAHSYDEVLEIIR